MIDNKPARIGLLEILRDSQGVQFVIPPYQRNYTKDVWITENGQPIGEHESLSDDNL